jgi:hypothetical protein
MKAKATRVNGRQAWIGFAATLLAGVIGLPACADQVPTAANACPCADGYVCCDSGVCAQDQSSCGVATAALSQSVQGVWTGYIENFQLSTDDSLTVAISVDPSGALSGQVTIGHATPPAPATDPALPWPVDLQGVTAKVPSYIPGFVYTAEDISWQTRRLKFRIAKYEPWQPWCALQQSYPVDATGTDFSCLPGGIVAQQVDPYTGRVLPWPAVVLDAQGNCLTATIPSAPVNCAKSVLCDTVGACVCDPSGCNCGGTGVCQCDATGCQAGAVWMSVPIGYWFDIAFDGALGDGSVNLSAGGSDLRNVRLAYATK